MYQFKTKFVFLVTAILLIGACAKSPGGKKTEPNPNIFGNLSFSTTEVNLGLVELNQTKNASFSITNVGNERTSALNLTGMTESSTAPTGQSPKITFNTTNCQGKLLNPNESCTVQVSINSDFDSAFNRSINIKNGTVTATVSISAYVYYFNQAINTLIQNILQTQQSSGSWILHTSDLANTALISLALAESSELSENPIFTSSIDFTSVNSNSWLGLDKALNFQLFDSDNTLLVFDKDASNSDFDTINSKWTNSTYSKPKQITPGLLYIKNKIYNKIYGQDMPDFDTLFDQYLDSRKLIEVSGNTVIGSSSSIKAHFAYLMDNRRWNKEYFAENALKEVGFLFQALDEKNLTNELDTLSRIYVDHWEYTLPEIQNLENNGQFTNIFNPGINLFYNPEEFNYTAFQKPGDFYTDNCQQSPTQFCPQDNKNLWFIGDYYIPNDFQSAYGFGCRNTSYALLNLVYAYHLGNWNSTEKTEIANLVKDGILEIKQNYACAYNATTKKYTIQSSDPSNNAIPVIMQIYSLLPNSIVPISEKTAMFNQLRDELNTNGSIDIIQQNANPVFRAEVLLLMNSLIDP